jgi:cellulose synthase/poly-beta-1,6-N-acetylglucosamine synthase-like glycosyltransferase
VYVYAGFPMLVVLIGKLFPRPVRKRAITPRVSLIIAAYNEESSIAARLENALDLDYPPEALEIIVASDGSTDATLQIAERFASRGVRVLPLPRRGKIHALAEAARRAEGEILVFSDANSMYDRRAIAALAQNFADPEVGGVAGHTSYSLQSGRESSSEGENLYWNYDTWLKQMESLTGSVVSAHGGMYAIRREFFPSVTDAAVTDDFAISTEVIERGRRLVFESGARGWEGTADVAQREFRRRVRLMTRGFRSVLLRRRLLNPFRSGFYAVVLFTHKVLRRLVALLLLPLFVTSLMLAVRGRIYTLMAAGQVLFYGLALAGLLFKRTARGRTKILYVPFFYCLANLASLVAFYRFVRGQRIERWEPQRSIAGLNNRTTGHRPAET